MDNFLQEIFKTLQENPSEPIAFEVGATIKRFSKKNLYEAVGCIQNALDARGIKADDRVVLIAPNSFNWIACDLAVMTFGAVTVPLYSRQAPSEWIWTIRDCQAQLTIVPDETTKLQLATLQEDIVCLTFEELLQYSFVPPSIKPAPSSLCTLVYTSGTSGLPKGAMITYDNMNFMLTRVIEHLNATLGNMTIPEIVFHYLPVCFMGSRILLFTQLCRGQAIHFSTDLTKLKEELSKVNPHYYLNVPAVLERIRTGVDQALKDKGLFFHHQMLAAQRVYYGASDTLKDRLGLLFCQKILFPKIRRQLGTNLKFMICGSAPLRAETQSWFEMLGISVLQVYGLTETTAIISMDHAGSAKAGYVGTPLPGVHISISEQGELLCKGPNNFAGYWNKPEETREAFADGWLKTGDLAEISTDGHLKILGRAKNVLVLESGHNVVSEFLEEKIHALCPGAEHVVVIGHGKPYLTAIIVGKTTHAQGQAAIDQVNAQLSHFKKIKNFFITDQSLTPESGLLTANQKMKRPQIQAYFHDVINKMYEGRSKTL